MPRSMWKGAIQLGLLTIPVKLYAATEAGGGLSFNMLHGCGQRINMKTHCPEHGEIPRSDTVKGYEWMKDQYVVVDDADFARVALPSLQTIAIDRFVEGRIPAFIKATYFLAPEPVGAKAYAMLRDVLIDHTAVAKVLIREREALCALSVIGEAITLQTLYWPDEMRNPGELDLPGDVGLTSAEKKMAASLVKSMTGPFDPARYHDDYREALLAVIHDKIEGTAPTSPTPVAAAPTVDLMAQLAASVEAIREGKA